MMDLIIKGLGIWIYATVLFYANPLNDSTRPDSPLNPFHPANIKAREETVKALRDEGTDIAQVVEWGNIWPVVCPVSTAIGSLVFYEMGQWVLQMVGK